MEHMDIDSGTAAVVDDVDKSDLKADFSSEFPVGLTLDFLPAFACLCRLLLPLHVPPWPGTTSLLPSAAGVPGTRSLPRSTWVRRLLSVPLAAPPVSPRCPRTLPVRLSLPVSPRSQSCVVQLGVNKSADPPAASSMNTVDTICFSSVSPCFLAVGPMLCYS